jgi:hypothetical protein
MNCKNCNDIISQTVSQKQFISNFSRKYKTILPSDFLVNDYCKPCLEMNEEDLKLELLTKNECIIHPPVKYEVEYFGNAKTFNTNYKGFISNNLEDGVYILNPNSVECQMVCNRFVDANKILFIEKNINTILMKKFKMHINDGKLVNLFHGSNNDNFDSILKNGLLIEKSSNGLMGVGIYGAENSEYSISYSKSITVKMTPEIKDALVNKKYANMTDSINIRAMLLCDFIIDKTAKELDNGYIGKIRAVYNNHHVYPGYLIYFHDGATIL